MEVDEPPPAEPELAVPLPFDPELFEVPVDPELFEPLDLVLEPVEVPVALGVDPGVLARDTDGSFTSDVVSALVAVLSWLRAAFCLAIAVSRLDESELRVSAKAA